MSVSQPVSETVDTPLPPRARALRLRIIEAARVAFLTEGFSVNMDAVAAAAVASKVTVYKYFGNKESLFVAVITEELDRALEEPVRLIASRLADSTDIRTDLTEACRAWVAGITTPDMIALRNLLAGELRRFPELGEAWQQRGPQRFHSVIAEALQRLIELGRLSITDVDLSVLQLAGLVVTPHLVYGTYGNPLDADLRDRLISSGVDMFLNQYLYRANT